MRARRIRGPLAALAAVVATLAAGIAVGLGFISLDLNRPAVGQVPIPTASPLPTLATPTATPAAPATPAPTTPPALALQMPISDDCIACHTTPDGGIGNVPVPPIGHPLEGWTACTSCHASDKLVATAPGHTGIHADQCLLCHKATTPAAEDRPHSLTANSSCLSCHGSIAPLSDSMKGRSERTCFLCHKGTSSEAPAFPHPVSVDGTCLACHVAAKVGGLPADHADRTDNQCTACHGPAASQPPVSPHDLKAYEAMCAFCHGASPRPSTSQSPKP